MTTTARTLICAGLLLAAMAACSKNSDKPAPAASQPSSDHAAAASPSTPTPPLDWKSLEAPLLTDHIQLTSRDDFVKAGEAYFDHHSPPRWVIFQAVPVPEHGKEADPFYSMYVAPLTYERDHITGLGKAIRISPEGSANTCGWFSPVEGHRVIFGSTLTRPGQTQRPGFQVGERKYVWMFPHEMELVTRVVPEIFYSLRASAPQPHWSADSQQAVPLFSRPNYDAECSYSKNGRFILYAHVRDEPTRGKDDADIWIYDTQTGQQHEIVHADGYDGGPFFSPDNKRICYRSDREGNDLLQLFVADLKFDASGVPVGIEREHQVTRNEHVNWAPYWHPSGAFLIYGTSEMGHTNYEVFAVEAPLAMDGAKPADQLRKRRITFANGADVLPVFSDDGTWMMWTAQRGKMADGEQKPSSQVWAARFDMPRPSLQNPVDAFFLPRFDPPRSEKDAVAIARKVIEQRNAGQAADADYRPSRHGSGWSVFVNFKPPTPGANATVEIDASGQVTEVVPGV